MPVPCSSEEVSISVLLIPAVLFLAGQLGQSEWCYVPPQSETLFCDYVSLSSCQSAHQDEHGAACMPRPRTRGRSRWRSPYLGCSSPHHACDPDQQARADEASDEIADPSP